MTIEVCLPPGDDNAALSKYLAKHLKLSAPYTGIKVTEGNALHVRVTYGRTSDSSGPRFFSDLIEKTLIPAFQKRA